MHRRGRPRGPPSSLAGRQRVQSVSGSPRSRFWLPAPRGTKRRRSPSGGGLDLELLQLADRRAVVHGETVAEVEQVLVLDPWVMLNLPPVVVEIFQVERVDAVLIHRRQHLADLVLVLVLKGIRMRLIDRLLGGDVDTPMVEHVAGVYGI